MITKSYSKHATNYTATAGNLQNSIILPNPAGISFSGWHYNGGHKNCQDSKYMPKLK